LNRDLIDEIGISDKFLKAAIAEKLREIEKRRRLYLGDKPQVELAGRCVIVVDDGIATGATVRVALKAVRDNQPEEVVLAVPLAPMDTIEMLQKDADTVHCVITPELFGAISIYYRDFRQVSDEEVVAYLKAAANRSSQ
jgi:putative phosphoribosyl transferase